MLARPSPMLPPKPAEKLLERPSPAKMKENSSSQAIATGKEYPDDALNLNSLANQYKDKGEYSKAEPLYLEAKEIQEKALGNVHPDYAMTLNNLASLYIDKGEYYKAEPLYLEVKEIQEKALGKEHPAYAMTLVNLSNVNRDKADFSINGLLEYSISDTRSNGDMYIIDAYPKENTDYPLGKGDSSMMFFNGIVEGASALSTPSLKLYVYNNKDARKPILSGAIQTERDAYGTLRFGHSQSLSSKRGLYYFIVRNEKEELLYCGKFTIGKYK